MYRVTLGLAALLVSPALQAYSVLTHEAIIDTTWDSNIKPLLLARFPQSTPDDLIKAHGYSYAGCILQDMGYYPFGSRFFSDLVHYVRTGDFVVNLIRESQDLNEYAFALGSLAHYAADTEGHSIAVNRSVPMEYPKLKRKFGNVVTYEDDPTAHIKVEFGFDVLQIARGNYAPQAYHDFIGFEVAKECLDRAFYATYSLHISDVFTDLDLALGTYRRTVSSLIPQMTRVAWSIKKDELAKARPGVTRRNFVYNLSKASYHKEWNGKYSQPGVGVRIVAFFIRILPKVGPLKALAFKAPTPQTEKLFEASFEKTLAQYRTRLKESQQNQFQLENRDFDTGEATKPTEYKMADDAFAKLAIKLSERDPSTVDPKLRNEVLAFFKDLELPFATKKDRKQWQQAVVAIEKLKAQATVAAR